ncbi:MAG: hypothetical protein DMG09_11585 [Acidobacteria bacterium]|nr:MAG: hypothetical protein DMG09_11585 [Acidobacteriota bacterium]
MFSPSIFTGPQLSAIGPAAPAGMVLVDRASIIIVQSPRFHGAVEYIAPGRTGTHTGPPSLSGRRGLSGAPGADARGLRPRRALRFPQFHDGDYLTGNRYVQKD